MAFPGVYRYTGNDLENWTERVRITSNGMLNGRTNNTDTITLTANQATTTVTLASGRLGNDTVVLFSPTTANAATEFGAGSLYVSSRDVSNSQFTITHANNAQADRIFRIVLVG